jgi:photosystem II stability/assembly factor-like uncharacterized protein
MRRGLARLAPTLVAALAAACPAGAAEVAATDPSVESAVLAPLASRSLLLDVAVVPGVPRTLVAVGERGHVLRSVDGGATWTQQRAPTRATLTAVTFADAAHGWAVGHDEVILRTTDGGTSWTRVHDAPERQQPLLDVWFGDAEHGVAVGAFATVYRTSDGGATWQTVEFAPTPLVPAPAKRAPSARDAADDDEGVNQPHLNAIAGRGQRLYVAGEAGHLYRSDDGGASWRTLTSPYEGSFFGVLPLDGDSLLAFGLRGHLFRSDDAGATWQALDSGSQALLSGATRLPDGSIVLVGLAGTVAVSRDGGHAFTVHREADRRAFAAVAPADSGAVLVGEAGVRVLPPAALGTAR